jgi:hypothetical protein
MTSLSFPALVDLQQSNWSAQRIAAALAIAGPYNELIAQAALERLDLCDHISSFDLWCDRHARRDI